MNEIEPKPKEPKEIYDMKSVVKKLETYMDRVTDKECTPSTVQAAVNCADKIIDIFKLHIDVERLNIKKGS